MHGLLSDVTYERLSGTSVLRDFVELPSQLFEHWLEQPHVIKKHFRHYQTGDAIPDELLQKMFAAQKFNQGFGTIEYTSSALVDLALHRIGSKGTIAAGDPAAGDPVAGSDGGGGGGGATAAGASTNEGVCVDGETLAPLLDVDVGAFEASESTRLGLPQGIMLRHRPAHFQHIFSTSMYAR
jgi:peptidyl-dipeptidase Dcp